MLVKQNNDRSVAPSWKGVISDGVRTAGMTCPNGHVASLSDHTIATDGKVSPSVVCPYEGCGFHEHVQLDGWDKPQPQPGELTNPLVEMMDEVMKELPLSLTNSEDGRYTWPQRWKRLRELLASATIDPALECPQNKCVYRGIRAFCGPCLRLADRLDNFTPLQKGL